MRPTFLASVGENQLIDDSPEYRSPWCLASTVLGIVKARDPDMRKAHREVLPLFLTSRNPPPHTVSKQKEAGWVGLPVCHSS